MNKNNSQRYEQFQTVFTQALIESGIITYQQLQEARSQYYFTCNSFEIQKMKNRRNGIMDRIDTILNVGSGQSSKYYFNTFSNEYKHFNYHHSQKQIKNYLINVVKQYNEQSHNLEQDQNYIFEQIQVEIQHKFGILNKNKLKQLFEQVFIQQGDEDQIMIEPLTAPQSESINQTTTHPNYDTDELIEQLKILLDNSLNQQ